MALLKLTDPATKIALNHPLLRAKARISRGAFCAVYDNGASVLELTCDELVTFGLLVGACPSLTPRPDSGERLVGVLLDPIYRLPRQPKFLRNR